MSKIKALTPSSITITITIKIKIGIPNGRRMRRPYELAGWKIRPPLLMQTGLE